MKVVCCVCRCIIRETGNDNVTSHGYCPKCFAEEIAAVNEWIAKKNKRKKPTDES